MDSVGLLSAIMLLFILISMALRVIYLLCIEGVKKRKSRRRLKRGSPKWRYCKNSIRPFPTKLDGLPVVYATNSSPEVLRIDPDLEMQPLTEGRRAVAGQNPTTIHTTQVQKPMFEAINEVVNEPIIKLKVIPRMMAPPGSPNADEAGNL